MKIVILCLTFFSILGFSDSKNKVEGIFYLKNIFGHLHKHPSQYSSSLTTIACNHPVRVYKSDESTPEGWKYVQASGQYGYIKEEFLVKRKIRCFQAKYPKFFGNMNMGLSDLYYWGRLYDQYVQGKSKVR